jgi:predicted RecA/RadA family phage recombinase
MFVALDYFFFEPSRDVPSVHWDGRSIVCVPIYPAKALTIQGVQSHAELYPGRQHVVVPAPYALTSGQGAKVGQMFGVATNDATLAADVALDLTGVFELTKIGSQAWTVGALVYWDDTNKRCTTVATANLLIGIAAAAVAGGAGNTTGRVRLNASFRENDP